MSGSHVDFHMKRLSSDETWQHVRVILAAIVGRRLCLVILYFVCNTQPMKFLMRIRIFMTSYMTGGMQKSDIEEGLVS